MKNLLKTSLINSKFFTEKRFIFRNPLEYEKCPVEQPGEKSKDIEKRLACLKRNTDRYNEKYKNGNDPDYDEFKKRDANDGPKNNGVEKLENMTEVMNKSLQLLSKHYMYFAFWSRMKGLGVENEARETIESAMKYKDELLYEEKNGVITITRKPQAKHIQEDFLIKIKMDYGGKKNNGVITTINKIEIKEVSLVGFDDEWASAEKQIETTAPKYLVRKGVKREPASENEGKWYKNIVTEIPKNVLKLLQLKNSLTAQEQIIKKQLEDLLNPKKPKRTILVTRELTYDKKTKTLGKLPTGLFQLTRLNSKTNKWEAFAVFSKEGFLMEDKNGQWVRSDGVKTPVAQTHTK